MSISEAVPVPQGPVQCKLCSSPAVVFSAIFDGHPLCGACRRGVAIEVAANLRKQQCSVCQSVGVVSVAQGLGYCPVHEGDARKMARLETAGQGIVDAALDALLTPTEELSVLAARLCEVSVAMGLKSPDLLFYVEQQWKVAMEHHLHKVKWMRGWDAAVASPDADAPNTEPEKHGFLVALRILDTMVNNGLGAEDSRQAASRSEIASAAYDEFQRQQA